MGFRDLLAFLAKEGLALAFILFVLAVILFF